MEASSKYLDRELINRHQDTLNGDSPGIDKSILFDCAIFKFWIVINNFLK